LDGDLAAKVGALLSDPTSAAKIAEIASGLTGAKPQSPAPAVKADPRMALLLSLKAVLKQDKQRKIDNLMGALSVLQVIDGTRRRDGDV